MGDFNVPAFTGNPSFIGVPASVGLPAVANISVIAGTVAFASIDTGECFCSRMQLLASPLSFAGVAVAGVHAIADTVVDILTVSGITAVV